MAKGRKTGGRQKGVANTKTREIAEKAIAKGITPLEVMLALMRKAWTAAGEALTDAEKERLEDKAAGHAKDAAPYLHPKLQPVDGRGSTDMNINIIIQKLGEKK